MSQHSPIPEDLITENERLRQENERLRDALRLAERPNDDFFALSSDFLCVSRGRYFVKISPALGRTLGYPDEYILSHPIEEMMHPDDIQPTRDAFNQLPELSKGFAYFENRFRQKDGNYVTISWRGHTSAEGLSYAIGRDVTERRKLQQALQRSEQVMKAVFNSSFYILMVFDTDFRIQAMNNKAVEVSRWLFNTEVRIGDSAVDVVVPERRGEFRMRLQRVLEGETIQHERRIVSSTDNRVYWYEILMTPVYDGEQLIGICYGAIDITERKNNSDQIQRMLEQEQMLTEELATQNEELTQNVEELRAMQDYLKNSEERFKKLYNETPALMLSLDWQGDIADVSNYWLDSTGYEKGEVIGQPLTFFIDYAFRQPVADAIAHGVKTGEYVFPECRARKKNGEMMDIILSAINSYSPEGELQVMAVLTDITDRKRARRELEQSEQRLQAIFNSNLMGIAVFDKNYKIQKINGKARKHVSQIRGTEIDEGGTMFDMVLPAEQERFLKAAELAFKGNTLKVAGKFSSERKGDVWLDLTYTPVIGSNHDVEYVVLGVLDTSKRRAAELDALQTKERLQHIFDNLDNIFWSYDPASQRMLLLSQGFEKMLGYRVDDYISNRLSLFDLVVPEDAELLQNAYKQALEGQDVEIEYRLPDAKGEVRWMHAQIKTYHDSESNALRLEGINTDITTGKQAEMALKESELNFRSIFEQASAGIFQLALDSRLIEMNDTFCAMLGYSREELREKGLYATVHPDHLEEALALMEKMKSGEVTQHKTERKYLHKDGHLVWGLINVSLVRGVDGKPRYVLGVVQNISELKKVQQDLTFKNNELDTFVYRASHDLRGPIASLRGMYNLARMEVKDEVMHGYFDIFDQSVNRLNTVLDNLIELTRIKETEMVKEEVNIGEIISECVALFANLPNFSNITFNTAIQLSEPMRSDPRLMKVIMQNLIENSIKYSRPSPQAYVNISIDDRVPQTIKIVVSDNGQGIRREFQDKIFNMFFRASDQSKGSGLGLYILKNALDRLNGTIRVDSEYGVGTTFTLFLPK